MSERRIAVFNDYDGLKAAFRMRMAELGVTNDTINGLAGLAPGHVGKLLAPNHTKNLGPISLTLMLQSLGLKLVAIEDRAASKRLRPRWERREKPLPQSYFFTASPVKAPTASRSFQLGRASAPMAPHAVQTMRGPKVSTGRSSGKLATSKTR